MTDAMRRGATTATAATVAYNRDLFPGLRVRAHTHFLDERRTRRRLGDWPWTFTRPIVQGHSDFSADGTPTTPPPPLRHLYSYTHSHTREREYTVTVSLLYFHYFGFSLTRARLIIIQFVSACISYAIRRRFNKPRKCTTLQHYVLIGIGIIIYRCRDKVRCPCDFWAEHVW